MVKLIFRIVPALCMLVSFAVTSPASARNAEGDPYVLHTRGVMEAFPAVADGFESRMEAYAEAGITHYFYCPSDDRYCNRWGWKFLYNDADRRDLRDYRAMCQRNGLEFVWTLNPSDSFAWSREDYEFLLNKLILMYYNGFRSFGVHLPDDERMDSVRELLSRDFVMCMKEKVNLYMIGEMPVVSYPAEADVARILMRGYRFDEDFRAKASGTGAVLCRMTVNDGFSSISVSAALDYARDPDGYSADRSIADAMDMMDADVKDAFMTFLQHTGGEGESEEIETFSLDTWTEFAENALYQEFDRIEKVPGMLQSAADAAIMEALHPWLVEFGRLGTRGKKTIECLRFYRAGDLGKFWLSYMESQMTDEETVSYSCYPVGEEKLQPFCTELMSEMIAAFADRLTVGALQPNLASTLYLTTNEAIDTDFHSYMASEGQAAFPIPAEANTCRLLTGALPDDNVVLFRQLGTDGELVAEFVVTSPYSEFDLKTGAVKVDIIGNVDIYESIFLYL